MNTKLPKDRQFNKYYLTYCKYMKLKGMQPKTIDAYSRVIRRIGNCFYARIDNLTMDQLLDCFHDLLDSHSLNTVKLDLYGLKCFYTNVLKKTWEDIPLIMPPKTSRIPDIVTTQQHPKFIFPSRKRGLKNSHLVDIPLDRGGIKVAIRKVVGR